MPGTNDTADNGEPVDTGEILQAPDITFEASSPSSLIDANDESSVTIAPSIAEHDTRSRQLSNSECYEDHEDDFTATFSPSDDLEEEDAHWDEPIKSIPKYRCCFSIRTFLLAFPVIVVVAVLFTGIFVWLLSFLTTSNSINDLSNSLQNEISQRIQTRCSALLDIPPLSAEVFIIVHDNGLIDITNFTSTTPTLWGYFRTFSELSFLTTSTEQGHYFAYERRVNGTTILYHAGPEIGQLRLAYHVDPLTGRPRPDWGPTRNDTGYNPTTRGWYKTARAANGSDWSSIYYFSTGTLGLTRSSVFKSSEGQILGVVTADFVLGELNIFLRSFKVSETGRAFIMEKNGLLVAASAGSIDDGAQEDRLPAKKSSDPYISSATAEILEEFKSLNELFAQGQHTSISRTYMVANERSTVLISRFLYRNQLDWIIVIVIPERDFMNTVNVNTAVTISVTFVTVIVSLIISLLISISIMLVISRPLGEISRQMRKFANINSATDSTFHGLSNLFEFIEIENALRRLKLGVSQFKKFVPKGLLRSALKNVQLSNVKLGTSSELSDCVLLYVGMVFSRYPIPKTYLRHPNSKNAQQPSNADEKDEQKYFSLVNQINSVVGVNTRKNKGLIAKYQGSGCLAVFSKAERAIRAALDIQKDTLQIQKQNNMILCLAVNKGQVSTGTVGEDGQFMEVSLVSPTVSLLSLVHSVGVRYGSRLVFTQDVNSARSLRSIPQRPLGRYRVKFDMESTAEHVEVREAMLDSFLYGKEKALNLSNISNTFSIAFSALFPKRDKSSEGLLTRGPLSGGLYSAKQPQFVSLNEALQLLTKVQIIRPSDLLVKESIENCKNLVFKNQRVQAELSIQSALRDSNLLEAFEFFCKSELSLENITLWKQINHFKQNFSNSSLDSKHSFIRNIYKVFIDPISEMQVNIDTKYRNLVKNLVDEKDELTETALDPLMLELEFLMSDTYTRFKKKDAYQKAFDISSHRVCMTESDVSLASVPLL